MTAWRFDRGFDRIARWYQALEWMRFGSRLHHARTVLLDRLPASRRTLFLGDGDGRLLADYVERRTGEPIVSVDLSLQMLCLQQERISNRSPDANVVWIQADSRRLPIMGSFDLIVVAFHLDCFPPDELRDVVATIVDRLAANGCLHVVDFVIPTEGTGRWSARIWIRVMIAFFRVVTGLRVKSLPDHRGELRKHRLSCVEEVMLDDWISAMMLQKVHDQAS